MSLETGLDSFKGTSEGRAGFGELDLNHNLKARAFINLCMGQAFSGLEKRVKLFRLREQGITPIMYYIDIQAAPTPISFGRPLTVDYEIKLQRSGEGAERRLLLNFDSVVTGYRSVGVSGKLGYEPERGPAVQVGRVQVLQVFTRPLAPPGERRVTEVPEELRMLKVHPWEAPYPSEALLKELPEGYAEVESAPPAQVNGVWGLPNTDINQHVTMMEYIMGLENLFSGLVFAAGLPLARHRIAREQLIFRRPFFPGDLYQLQGRLWRKGEKTMFQGGIFAVEGEGVPAPRASVSVSYEGSLEEASPA